jgi:hypothetical protein
MQVFAEFRVRLTLRSSETLEFVGMAIIRVRGGLFLGRHLGRVLCCTRTGR